MRAILLRMYSNHFHSTESLASRCSRRTRPQTWNSNMSNVLCLERWSSPVDLISAP